MDILQEDYEKFLLVECDSILFKRYNRFLKKEIQYKLRKCSKAPKNMNDPTIKDITKKMLQLNQPMPFVINSSILTSFLLDSSLIIAVTVTGEIAVELSNQRPKCQIISVLPHNRMDVARKLVIYRNVIPIAYQGKCAHGDKDIKCKLNFGLNYAKQIGLVTVGDLVIYCYDSTSNDSTKMEEPNVYQALYVPLKRIEV